MGLSISLIENKPTVIYDDSITHNLVDMAKAANLYYVLWRPQELQIEVAADLIKPLQLGLKNLTTDPEKFKAMNHPNGYGKYEELVNLVQKYLSACRENPEAKVEVWR